ncbi:DNA alkylation repair protein [bacterium]|nr:DNA alkylation repair protein [bacterium]
MYDTELIKEVRAELQLLGGHNAGFYESIIPNAKPILGVRMKDLRALAKRIAKSDYRRFLDGNPADIFELEMLQALVIGCARDDIEILLDYFGKTVPLLHDWSVCDSLCQNFKIAQKRRAEVYAFISRYFASKAEFEARTAAVMLLSHFLTDEYIDRALAVLDSLCTERYYASMGAAWAVSAAAVKHPERTLAYLRSGACRLDKNTFNKSIQKICESYRISPEYKETVKKLRRP